MQYQLRWRKVRYCTFLVRGSSRCLVLGMWLIHNLFSNVTVENYIQKARRSVFFFFSRTVFYKASWTVVYFVFTCSVLGEERVKLYTEAPPTVCSQIPDLRAHAPTRLPGGDDWHVLGWWYQHPKILHLLSEQAQGSQNGPPFPRSILSLVLLILGQLSQGGGKKEEEVVCRHIVNTQYCCWKDELKKYMTYWRKWMGVRNVLKFG